MLGSAAERHQVPGLHAVWADVLRVFFSEGFHHLRLLLDFSDAFGFGLLGLFHAACSLDAALAQARFALRGPLAL